jgi:hypothetical protein
MTAVEKSGDATIAMRCSKCAAENREGRSCAQCGASLKDARALLDELGA